jgi:hypothetical protein
MLPFSFNLLHGSLTFLIESLGRSIQACSFLAQVPPLFFSILPLFSQSLLKL